jgi:hypothetical protein
MLWKKEKFVVPAGPASLSLCRLSHLGSFSFME